MLYHKLNARFPRKRAFITGGGSGLGLELARALAADGWTLGLFDRNLERLTTIEGELTAAHVPITAYPGDVTHADELTVAVNSFAETYDGLDVMVNNAGVAASGALKDALLEDWRWIIDTNLMGVVHGCRAAIPHLQRNGSGVLINVASAAAFASTPDTAAYNATKAAVLSLSETLVNELRDARTQVSVVMPMYFKTNLLETARGSDEARAFVAAAMAAATYQAPDVARDVLLMAGAGETYIVLPRSARMLWRFKRWAPKAFLRDIVRLREQLLR